MYNLRKEKEKGPSHLISLSTSHVARQYFSLSSLSQRSSSALVNHIRQIIIMLAFLAYIYRPATLFPDAISNSIIIHNQQPQQPIFCWAYLFSLWDQVNKIFDDHSNAKLRSWISRIHYPGFMVVQNQLGLEMCV